MRKGATMFCPKCKARIGMHLNRFMTTIHMAQGMTCCVCGYWVEKGFSNVSISKSSKRAIKR